MESVTTQAPIQVRQDTTLRHERMFPLLVAESLTCAEEYLQDDTGNRVDMWNGYGLKMDRDYYRSGHPGSRAEYIGSLITRRYDLLQEHYNIDRQARAVIRDDDPEVAEIVTDEVRQLIGTGVMRIHESSFTHCNDCERAIAPVTADVQDCPTMSGHSLSVVSKRGLFLQVPDSAKTWITETAQTANPHITSLLRSAAHNLPPEIQASKQRDHGIPLTEFGVDEDFVVDPLITLSMLKKILLARGQGQLDTVVLGRDTVKNYIPYSMLTGNGEGVRYIATGMLPPYTLDEGQIDTQFYYPYLPLHMSSQVRDLSKGQLQMLQREYSKVQRKFDASLHFLEERCGQTGAQSDSVEDSESADKLFAPVHEHLQAQDMRGAMLAFRHALFTDVSRKYIPALKANGTIPNQDIINKLKELHRVLYGS